MGTRLRFSIRYKTLAVIASVLLAASALYLYLATSLFTVDKLASVYDVNAALVDTLSEETNLYFGLLGEKLAFVAEQMFSPQVPAERRAALAKDFLTREPEIVQLELYEERDGRFERALAQADATALDEMSVTLPDLEETRQSWPVPFESLEALGTYVRNDSLPPDAALLTVAVPLPAHGAGPARAVVAEVKASRLLRILGRSEIYTTYLVDGHGTVLVHPRTKLMLDKVSFRQRSIVRDALEGSVRTGVREYAVGPDQRMLGSFSKLETAGMVVVSEIPKADALRTNGLLVKRSLLFGIAILLGALVASIFFARRLSLPIMRLRLAAKAASQGRFDVPVKAASRDEIGDLADAFQELLSGLRTIQTQVAGRERQAALARFGEPLVDALVAALGKNDSETAKRAAAALRVLLARDTGEPQRLDVNAFVSQALEVLSPLVRSRGCTVDCRLGEGVPAVSGRPTDLFQVMLHHVINADEAMPAGGTVTVLTAADEVGRAVISVHDTGKGIAPELHQRVFAPFFTTKPPGEGLGLGLAIVFEVVRAHEGIVFLDSSTGEGATFKVCLPPA